MSNNLLYKEEIEVLNKEPKFNVKKIGISVGVFVALAIIIAMFVPDTAEEFGVLALFPALFLIGYIFWTKRILESLALASALALFMLYKWDFFGIFNETLSEVLMGEDTVWLFIVCGLMGSIIALVEKSGGAQAFGDFISTKAKTRKSTLMWTWVLGIFIFIDDYLNSLTVGSCMAPVTDKHKVSREYLAYVVDSTAAPICVLIPISTWAVFASKLLEANGLAAEGEGLLFFIKTIPFNFYGWFAVLIVPLVILGVIPTFGPMKKAEQRALETGVLAPPGSEKIDIRAGEHVEIPKNPKVMNFFLPIVFLVVSTIYFDVDMMMGVISTMIFTFILYVSQGIVSAEEFADVSVKGIKNMLLPLLLMVLAFVFAAANEQIGFIQYVINSTAPILSPQLMPVIMFAILGVTEFITGTNWGMYIIALPIVIPLALQVGANPVLCVAAVLSAGVWGSHICFYSDATILSSSASGCDNYRHAVTQMPFGFLAAGLSAVAFLVAGFIF